MQTKIAAMKNMRYGLSLNKTKASVPKAFEATPSVFPFGGVFGKMKLITPKAIDAMAAMLNVFGVFSMAGRQ